MSDVIILFKVMPESPSVNLDNLKKECIEVVSKAGEVGKVEIKPVAFGLQSINLHVVCKEEEGSPDEVEEELNKLEDVNRAEIEDVRRTMDV